MLQTGDTPSYKTTGVDEGFGVPVEISDQYRATASLTTLTFRTSDPGEVPVLTTVCPYGDSLAVTSVA